jgi:ADP-ribose pyrophosphatase
VNILAETRFLRLVQAGHWTYAQRPNSVGAIAILAVTPNREIILIDQYRIPMGGRVIELPAGLVGDVPGNERETLEQAARRELLEEVGYEAEDIKVLIHGASSAGITDERVHLVSASGLRRVAAGGGDSHEDIVVCHVPIDSVEDWLANQVKAGKDVDLKVFAGLYFVHSQYRNAR